MTPKPTKADLARKRQTARLNAARLAAGTSVAGELELHIRHLLGEDGDEDPTGQPSAQELAVVIVKRLERDGHGIHPPAELDAEEQEAMDHLLDFMACLRAWGLRSNEGELASAIHVLQGFVIQHMLKRVAGDAWGTWYASQSEDVEDSPAAAHAEEQHG